MSAPTLTTPLAPFAPQCSTRADTGCTAFDIATLISDAEAVKILEDHESGMAHIRAPPAA